MFGRIRLGCISCSREDYDGIDELPDDWIDVDELQSFEQSFRHGRAGHGDVSIVFWETHLGVCPECQRRAPRLTAQQTDVPTAEAT